MVPNPEMTNDPASNPTDTSYPGGSYPTDTSSPGDSYPNNYPSNSYSSLSSSLPVETGSPSDGAPPSQYTPPPPQYSSVSEMPYSSFTGGGYSQMDCGYGYKKDYEGKCSPESWVCPSFSFARRICADRACDFSGRTAIGVVIRPRSSSTTTSHSKPILAEVGRSLISHSSQNCPPPHTVTVTYKDIETSTLTVTYTQVCSDIPHQISRGLTLHNFSPSRPPSTTP